MNELALYLGPERACLPVDESTHKETDQGSNKSSTLFLSVAAKDVC